MPIFERIARITCPYEDQRLLTADETAKYLGRKIQWVRRTLTKKIPVVRDGELRFDIRDLDQYIENAKTVVTGNKD